MYAEVVGEGSSNRKKSMPSKVSLVSSTNKKNIQCIECGFSCTSYAQLKVHNRIHTGDKPYGCPECSYASTRNANLQRHIASMHAGRFASPATGKRGRPPNSVNASMTADGKKLHSPLQSLNPTGKSNPTDFHESVIQRETVKSPLSEIRAREIMLAENASHHATGFPLDVNPGVMDTGIRPRLLHPASQVLALPTHIPLAQPNVSGYNVSNTVVDEPIVIEDDPEVDTENKNSKPVEDNKLDETGVEAHTLPDKPIETYNETVILQSEKVAADDQAPVIIASHGTSEDLVNVEPPLTPMKQKENDGFGSIVNDGLCTNQVGHHLSQEKTNVQSPTPVPSVIPVYQEMPTARGVDLTTAKFNQKNPLVLEVENSSIGLYLHLDLSKYLCEAAQRWLSQHTQKCTNVCQANFPVNTSNPPDQVPLMDTSELKETQESIPTVPIMPMSNKVHTISKAPPVIPARSPPSEAQAFPTAILAAQTQPAVSSIVENEAPEHLNFPNLSETNLPRENSVNVDQGIPRGRTILLNPAIKPIIHSRTKKVPSRYSRLSDSGTLTDHNSLLFQRWPGIKQFMQIHSLAGNQKEFSCYKCGKQFSHFHQLKVHVKNHIKRYHCQQCHYSTHRMANLRRHQLTHRQVEELTCHLCGGVMANKRAYTMHVLFAHKKQKRKSKEFDLWRKQLSVTMAGSSVPDGNMTVDDTLPPASKHHHHEHNASEMDLDAVERPEAGDMLQGNNEAVDSVESTYQKEQTSENDADHQSLESTEVEAQAQDCTAESEDWSEVAMKEESMGDVDAANDKISTEEIRPQEDLQSASDIDDIADGDNTITIKQELPTIET